MFYDYDRSSRPRQIKTRKEIEEILEKKPLTREGVLEVLKIFEVWISFQEGLENPGYLLPIGNKVMSIHIKKELEAREQKEVIWHEMLHLYLRYLFNGVINDDGPDCDYHDLIVAEGKRLALNPPLPIEKYFKYNEAMDRWENIFPYQQGMLF